MSHQRGIARKQNSYDNRYKNEEDRSDWNNIPCDYADFYRL